MGFRKLSPEEQHAADMSKARIKNAEDREQGPCEHRHTRPGIPFHPDICEDCGEEL